MIYSTETYLDSTVDPNNLLINGYDLHRADHLDNVKGGAVCLYYRENLSLQLADTPYIEQCILCEINIPNTTGYVVVVYRSPSQSSNEFEEFLVLTSYWTKLLCLNLLLQLYLEDLMQDLKLGIEMT